MDSPKNTPPTDRLPLNRIDLRLRQSPSTAVPGSPMLDSAECSRCETGGCRGAVRLVGETREIRVRQCSGLGSTRSPLSSPQNTPPTDRPPLNRIDLCLRQSPSTTVPGSPDTPKNGGGCYGHGVLAGGWRNPGKPGMAVRGLRFNAGPFEVTR